MDEYYSMLVPKFEGHCKIELNNEKTGEKQVIEKDNAIFPAFYRVLENMALAMLKDSFLQYAPLGNCNIAKTGLTRMLSTRKSRNILNRIVYTDNTAIVPQDALYLPGNVIGYSTMETYASTSTNKRGNPDYSKFEVDKDKFKFEFEFKTNEGNGTFQTIGFEKSDSETRKGNVSDGDFLFNVGTALTGDYVNNKLYGISGSLSATFKIRCIDVTTNVVTYSESIELPADMVKNKITFQCIKYYSGKLYFGITESGSYNPYHKIRGYDLITNSWDGTNVYSKMVQSNNFSFFIKDGVIYYEADLNNNDDLRKTIAIETKTVTDMALPDNYDDYYHYGDKEYNPAKDKIYAYSTSGYSHEYATIEDYNSGTYTDRVNYGNSGLMYVFGDRKFTYNGGCYYSKQSSNNSSYEDFNNNLGLTLIEITPAVSNVLTALVLESPVTKTSEQTMKITYTLNYTLPSEAEVTV